MWFTLPDTRGQGTHTAYEVCSMSQHTMKKYPAAFKERAVKLAVESDQPIAQTARDLGVNENTLHTWIGKYLIPSHLVVKYSALHNSLEISMGYPFIYQKLGKAVE